MAIKNVVIKNLFFCIIAFGVISCKSYSSMEISTLQCEALNNPLGIDNTSPHFSWLLYSDKQNAKQTAYQILILLRRIFFPKAKQTYGTREK